MAAEQTALNLFMGGNYRTTQAEAAPRSEPQKIAYKKQIRARPAVQGNRLLLPNPPATHYDITVIENRRLPGRDRALRLIEGDKNLVRPGLLDHCRGRFVAMANLHADPHRLTQIIDGNQIRAPRNQRLRVQVLLLAHHYL